MSQNSIISDHRLPVLAAGGVLLLGVVGIAFYGWLQFGSGIILSLAETGLSWCF